MTSYTAPAMPLPATESQLNFLRDLVANRDLSNYPVHKADIVRLFVSGQRQLPRSSVSAAIDELKALPLLHSKTGQAPTQTDVPEGSYAVDGEAGTLKFYRVDRPTEGRWAGYTFVKVQASDDYYPVRGNAAREAVLAAIAAAGIQAAMSRYGREIGECGHCHRTLTNEESRARGIGPICAEKMGW